jgi:hypothetical protein
MQGCTMNNGTANDQIDALLKEDAALKLQIGALEVKRATLRDALSEFGEGAMDRWFHQEYAREFALNARREAKRRQRREAVEQQDEEVARLRRRLDVNGTAIVEALKLRAQR